MNSEPNERIRSTQRALVVVGQVLAWLGLVIQWAFFGRYALLCLKAYRERGALDFPFIQVRTSGAVAFVLYCFLLYSLLEALGRVPAGPLAKILLWLAAAAYCIGLITGAIGILPR